MDRQRLAGSCGDAPDAVLRWTMSRFDIALPPALSDFVHRQVAAGLYDSPADAITDAVRKLAETDESKLTALRAALAPGVAEANAGIFYDGDMSDIIAEARGRPKRK
jgi:putative addiction module CopG family antidote